VRKKGRCRGLVGGKERPKSGNSERHSKKTAKTLRGSSRKRQERARWRFDRLERSRGQWNKVRRIGRKEEGRGSQRKGETDGAGEVLGVFTASRGMKGRDESTG